MIWGRAADAARPQKERLLLVQFKDRHKLLSGQLNGTQGAHFLLACSHTGKSVWGPSFFNARAEVNSAGANSPLRCEFTAQAPPRRAGPQGRQKKMPYSSSSLSTAINASVGS